VTALDPSKYNPDRSFPAKIKRRLTLWRVAKPMPTTPRKGIISFTFDDFPKSAAQHGAEAMDMIGASATYYTCTGMAGHTNVMGDIFTADDIAPLIKAGHEIGTHTETHLDCARVDTETIRSEISTNAANLEAIIGKTPEPHFAWRNAFQREVVYRGYSQHRTRYLARHQPQGLRPNAASIFRAYT
jgi:peptidoglycan/xylan/chitin deacetylase (PgdA/CDA1 family)